MKTRKVFLELKATDYSVGKFVIDVSSLEIKNPKKIGILSSTVKLDEDSDYVMIHPNQLAKLHKEALAGTNSGFSQLVYSLVPEHNIVRSVTNTQSNGGNNQGGAPSVDDVLDSHIVAFGTDVRIWIDLAPARTLSANFSQASAVGDLFHHTFHIDCSVPQKSGEKFPDRIFGELEFPKTGEKFPKNIILFACGGLKKSF